MAEWQKIRNIAGIIFLALFVVLVILIFIPQLQDPPRGFYANTAQSTLRIVAGEAESYKQEHGTYPRSMADLLAGDKPYLTIDYCKQGTNWYRYQCNFSADGYVIVAAPYGEIKKDRINKTYTIRTGFILSQGK